ncbi:transposase [Chryseobacterium sp. L7]|uniref:Transposase n=1 Tax=Chryseobacterium endalhagicum TaxID=2797638 RepID=A0ABS1QDF4_9FLAO|nr:transposase [Chryseobacterium endalhagicum]MBL1220627.1 transposase [Chryseobacterium endalhagicum]
MKNFEHIHIGALIKTRKEELDMDLQRICNFFEDTTENIEKMYQSEHLDSQLLLRWSKLLEYDFFRVYSQHLILFAPSAAGGKIRRKVTDLPQFRKNIYTKEIIDFILELHETKKKTINQIVQDYRIPKTTLYKWISKYKKTK